MRHERICLGDIAERGTVKYYKVRVINVRVTSLNINTVLSTLIMLLKINWMSLIGYNHHLHEFMHREKMLLYLTCETVLSM